MKAFVPFSFLLIALSPVAATSQQADAVAEPGERVMVMGRDGMPRAHGLTVGHHERARGHGDGAARRFSGLIEAFDTDGDGAITQEEVDAARTARLAAFDADGDGELTLEEYQALWLDAMHERMVDRFQAHDDDGTGTVTVEEFLEDYADIVERGDRNEDGKVSKEDFVRPNRRAPAPEAE